MKSVIYRQLATILLGDWRLKWSQVTSSSSDNGVCVSAAGNLLADQCGVCCAVSGCCGPVLCGLVQEPRRDMYQAFVWPLWWALLCHSQYKSDYSWIMLKSKLSDYFFLLPICVKHIHNHTFHRHLIMGWVFFPYRLLLGYYSFQGSWRSLTYISLTSAFILCC